MRPLKPEQLSRERVQVLGTLDARGEYALLAYPSGDDVAPRVAISRWRRDERCEVPVLGEPVATPLARALGSSSGPVLYVPLAVDMAGEQTLMLVDEQCRTYGPFGAIEPRTARTAVSAHDQRGYLLFRDAAGTLSVLDPKLGLSARALAHEVEAMRATTETVGEQRDAVWIAAAGELSLRTLSGELLASMGDDVHAFTLSGDGTRVAFVDGTDLYEAVAPRFRPRMLASDACKPRYGRGTLDLYAPCAQEALQRVHLSSGEWQPFEPGVFASREQEGVQLDFSTDDEGHTQLTAAYADGTRMRVQPTLAPDATYVLNEEEISGLDEEGRFGVFRRSDESFSPWLQNVTEVVPHHSGKKHSFEWLVYHDVDDAVGTLTLVDDQGGRSEIGRSVPLPAQQGFVVEDGGAVVQFPFSAPLVVLLENARAMDALGGRFCGRLKALSITGAPRAILAEDVCSYALVAAPVPGVLYSVERGPRQGLWFVAL